MSMKSDVFLTHLVSLPIVSMKSCISSLYSLCDDSGVYDWAMDGYRDENGIISFHLTVIFEKGSKPVMMFVSNGNVEIKGE